MVPPFDPTVFEPIFNLVGKALSKAAGKAWENVQWRRASQEYARKMRERYSTTRVLGKLNSISLEGIYTDVHVLDRASALRRFTLDELELEHSQQRTRHRFGERHSGLAIVQRTEKLFILGKPGAGKTTFCRYLVLQTLEGKLTNVPIFVSLHDLARSGRNVLEYIASEFEACGFPDTMAFVKQLLDSGKAIVLFDGLDEVQQAEDKQASVTQEIKHFVDYYDKCHYVVTCRVAATQYVFERFTYVEMADFTEAQIQSFVHKWFKDDLQQARDFWQELQQPDDRGLQDLARVPLLLSLLCLAYEQMQRFPKRRSELYEEALDALLQRWDMTRGIRRDAIYRKLSLRRKRQMLAHVAAVTFEKGQYFILQDVLAQQIEDYLLHVPVADVEEEIEGTVVLGAVEAQHGILIERAQRIYSFAHLTFQEYFTARYIVDYATKGTLDDLIQHHTTDLRWREVFLNTASMLGTADKFFVLFAGKLDTIAASHQPLTELFSWIRDEEKASQLHTTPIVRRLLILVSALGHNLWRTLQSAQPLASNLDRVLVKAIARTRDLADARDLTHDLDRALTLASPLARDLNRTLTFASTLASPLSQAVGLALTFEFDSGLVDARELASAHDLARELADACDSARELADDLARARDLLDTRDRADARDRALERAHDLILTVAPTRARDLAVARSIIDNFPSFSEPSADGREKTLDKLGEYLTTAKLMIDCLHLAYVSEREAIEERLLLPIS